MSAITPASVQPGTYNIDPAHSRVGFAVKHMGISTVHGNFNKFEGTIEASDGALKLGGTVEVASLNTGDENRDNHLQTPDFFDAAQFPQITFHSTELDGSSAGDLKLRGEITIKGITKPIELTGQLSEGGQDPWGNERIGIEVEGKVDRREFGLQFNQTLPGGNLLVSNEVKLIISVSAAKANAQ